MRGMPDKLATREDVYNVAMDLPPDQAKAFLDGLTPKAVNGLLNAEELVILKGNVAWARGLAQAKEARLAQKNTELKVATRRQAELQKARPDLERRLKDLTAAIESVKVEIVKLNEPMVDRRSELQEKIALEKNLLPTLDKQLNDLAAQLQAVAVKKANVKEGIRDLEETLKVHEKDLQAGHSEDTKKQIEAAGGKLTECAVQHSSVLAALVQNNAETKATEDLVDSLTAQIGDLNNG